MAIKSWPLGLYCFFFFFTQKVSFSHVSEKYLSD